MISKVKWKTEISCVPDHLSAFFQHGVRSSAACGGEPADIRSRNVAGKSVGNRGQSEINSSQQTSPILDCKCLPARVLSR